MLRKDKDRIFQIIKVLISATIIYFIVKHIETNADALQNFEFRVNYFYLTVSSIVLLVFIINKFLLWHYITKLSQCNIGFSESVIARAYAEFGKYVPGKVLGYATLLLTYTKANQSKKLVGLSMFLELLASVLSVSLIFLFSLSFSGLPEFQKYRTAAFIFLGLFIIVMHPKILNCFSNIFLRIFNREPIKIGITYGQILKIAVLHVVNFMVFGLAFVIFINSIYPVSFSNFLFITGTVTMAILIGLFAIFVPAGLGVREAVSVLALSYIMPPSVAGIIALTSRLWITIAEILLFCCILSRLRGAAGADRVF